MGRSVSIKTPIPSAKQVAKRLGMSDVRLRGIQGIVKEKSSRVKVSTLRETYGHNLFPGFRGDVTLGEIKKRAEASPRPRRAARPAEDESTGHETGKHAETARRA